MPALKDNLRPRFLVLAAIFTGVLFILLIRLWTMQVINGAEYVTLAEQNRIREVTMVAPRGRILDRNGIVLVDNRATLAVLAERSVLDNAATIKRLADLIGIPSTAIESRILTSREAALAPHAVMLDAPVRVVSYLAEHPDLFPGISVEPRTVRTYPFGALAAHVLGYAGGISDDELASETFIDYDPGDVVGKTGAEAQFESILQGDRGVRTVEVDAVGRVRRVISEIEPEPGRDVMLTIDINAQRVAEEALQQAFAAAAGLGFPQANAGSVVALDVKTGETLAMASAPTFAPEKFVGGITTEEWDSITSKESGYPLNNRAISSGYAPASTFKAFVGLAGLQNGIVTPGTTSNCQGTWTGFGTQWKKMCWKHSGHGAITFERAIAESCDVYFYDVGKAFYNTGNESLQAYIDSWGYGSKTGIDLPGEVTGRVPDIAWKKDFNKNYPEYQKWLPGDTVNMSIGQGDALATPLQIAASYAGIANDGKLMRPHVFKAAVSDTGVPIIEAKSEVFATPEVSAANLTTIQSALRRVITNGTGASAFRNMSVPSAGKTGTAQVAGKEDYALYVGYAPYDDPQYSVSVVIEQGGGGGAVASSAARKVLSSLLGLDTGYVPTAQDFSR